MLSAAMSYYAALSIFPLLLVLLSALGFLMRYSPNIRGEREVLLQVVGENVGSWVATQLGGLLEGVEIQAAVGGPLGLAGVIAAALGMFVQFDTLLDRIWDAPRPADTGLAGAIRSVLLQRLHAFGMLLGVGGLVVLVFVIDLVLSAVRPLVTDLPAGQQLWQATQLLLSLTIHALLFGVIYKTLPRAPVRWRNALAPALLVASAWKAGQSVLISLVIGEHFTAYGLVGSFIAVMLWLYYASAALFFGAELVRAQDVSAAQLGK